MADRLPLALRKQDIKSMRIAYGCPMSKLILILGDQLSPVIASLRQWQPGDVILSLGGEPTNTPQEVLFRLSALGIDTQAELVWWRDGAEMQASMVLAPAPDDPPRDTTTLTDDVSLRGLTVARINPAVMAELNLPMQAEGVAVLMAEDLAARAGFQPGDVIATGTPAGVGIGFTPPKFLKRGDRVTIEIEGLGRLSNTVA